MVADLAKDMNADGYAEVCGVDWCDKLIDKLNSRVDTPGLSFEHVKSVQDIGGTHPKFPEGSVDYVIDKALLDSILVSRLLHLAAHAHRRSRTPLRWSV